MSRGKLLTLNKRKIKMSIKTAEHHIDSLARQLDEDSYGVNGDLDDEQIRERLMQSIVERFNDSRPGTRGRDVEMSVSEDENEPVLTLSQAASMLIAVYDHMDRQFWDNIALFTEQRKPLLPATVEKLTNIINIRTRRYET
jgi:hypothetical protein